MTGDEAPARRRIIVIGGGISGLVAARELAGDFDVVLLEAQATTGGLIRTEQLRGRAVDTGADVFITRTPDAEKLARDLGLGGALVAPATTAAAVFARGAVRPLPAGLVLGVPTDLHALWRSGIVSRWSVLRALGDLVGIGASDEDPTGSQHTDPTIAEVFEPRLGRGIVANLINPLLGGINAGDVHTLSFPATVPMLAEATAGSTSVIRALRPLAGRDPAGSASPAFFGFADGMATLSDRLAGEVRRLGVTIRTSTEARQLTAADSRSIRVETSSDPVTAAGALVALPAWAIAPLILPMSAALAGELAAIPYASVATITLAYEIKDATNPSRLAGSGILVPRGDALCTAFTFISTKWPGPSDDEDFVVRASVGRYGDQRALDLDNYELTRRVRGEIATTLGITAEPVGVHVERFERAFPQYVAGHLARCDRISQLADGLGPVVITGSWSAGIGIPSCIAAARAAARRLADKVQ